MKWLSLASIGLLLAPEIAIAQQHAPQTRPAPGARPGGSGPGARPGQGQRPPGVRPNPGARPTNPVVRPPNPGVRPPNPGGQRPPVTRPPVAHPRPGNPHRPPSGNIGHRPPNFRPIPAPTYRYPRGYRYRRWSVGLILPSLFLSSAYYFNNYATYGIYPPPPGYRWIRYGPDLLLVNTRNGRIEDVFYGAFR